MSSTRAAIRYAKAILEIAASKNQTNEVNNDMNQIASTLNSNAELDTFIQNPTISVEVKESALLAVFEQSHAVTKSLFHLLFQNKRFEILGAIAQEYLRLFNVLNDIEVAKVTTAFEMDSVLETKIKEKIATFTTKKVSINNIIDPSILGGFILRIGDKQYNGSVASRLQVLKRELSN